MAKNELWGYFPGSPVAKTVYSQCRGPGLIPGQGTRGFPCGSAGKESTCNVGDLFLIPGLGRSSGEGKGYPLQYSGLENAMDSPWGCKKLDMTWRQHMYVPRFSVYEVFCFMSSLILTIF